MRAGRAPAGRILCLAARARRPRLCFREDSKLARKARLFSHPFKYMYPGYLLPRLKRRPCGLDTKETHKDILFFPFGIYWRRGLFLSLCFPAVRFILFMGKAKYHTVLSQIHNHPLIMRKIAFSDHFPLNIFVLAPNLFMSLSRVNLTVYSQVRT